MSSQFVVGSDDMALGGPGCVLVEPKVYRQECFTVVVGYGDWDLDVHTLLRWQVDSAE